MVSRSIRYSSASDRPILFLIIGVLYGVALHSCAMQAHADQFGLPQCNAVLHLDSNPVTVTVTPKGADPCISTSETGAYIVSSSKAYILRCGPYDCTAMAHNYHRTGRVPDPIDGKPPAARISATAGDRLPFPYSPMDDHNNVITVYLDTGGSVQSYQAFLDANPSATFEFVGTCASACTMAEAREGQPPCGAAGVTERYFCGFHSRASRCASAICAGVIFLAN